MGAFLPVDNHTLWRGCYRLYRTSGYAASATNAFVFMPDDLRREYLIFRIMAPGTKQGTTFDIIYADPPYRSGFEEKLAQLIGQSDIVKEDTLVIFESALETPIDFIDEDVYEIEKVKEYKTNKHIFLRVKKER